MDRRDELVRAVRGAAARLGTGTVSLRDFKRETGIGDGAIYAHFDSWIDLCQEAGVAAARRAGPIGDDEMFGAMRDAFVQMIGIGSYKRFERHFRHGMSLFRRRGLGWGQALAAFRAWAETNAPDFPYLDDLPRIAPPQMARTTSETAPALPPPACWRANEGRTLGEVINFRALLHAPVNEAGVMVLFGMVARDLGFVVETVAPGFPDCEAKRRVAAERGTRGERGARWQRVRIEFEYQSRNFRGHGHDPEGCDLIVCWRHNWPDCPVEVVELRAAIGELAG